MAWIIKNQLNRRNITAYQRTELVLILEPMIREKAKENQINAGENYGKGMENKQLCHNCDKAIDTKKELANAAGVSHGTIVDSIVPAFFISQLPYLQKR